MDFSEEYRRGFEDARRHAILATRVGEGNDQMDRGYHIRRHLEIITPESCLEFEAECKKHRVRHGSDPKEE